MYFFVNTAKKIVLLTPLVVRTSQNIRLIQVWLVSLLPITTMSTTPDVKLTSTEEGDGKYTFNISITMDIPRQATTAPSKPDKSGEFVNVNPATVCVKVHELDGESQRTVTMRVKEDDDSVSSYEDDCTVYGHASDTKSLMKDIEHWEVKAFYVKKLLVWPADRRSVYRTDDMSVPVIYTGTLYDKPIYLDKTVHGEGYWVEKHSRLGELFLQNHRFKKELTARETLKSDLKKHWFVKSFNPDGDPDHNALIGITDKSAFACQWYVKDTYGIYHRDLYYVKEDDGYWVNKDSDLVKMIRESGNAGREDPITKAEQEAEDADEKAKRLDAETKALRADLPNWEIIDDVDKTLSGCFRYERSLLIDARVPQSRFWDAKFMMAINKVPTGHLYHRPTIDRHGIDRGFWIDRDSPLGRLMLEKRLEHHRKLKVVVPDEDKPIENVPNIQNDWKNWKIVRWEDKENVIIKPTEESVFSHCPAVFNGKLGVPVVWAKTGPSPNQKSMLKYDHNCEGYRIHFSSVLMVFLPRYTYEEYYYSQYGRYPDDSIPLLADDVEHWEFVTWKDSNRIIVRPGSMSKYHNCPAIVSLARHKSIGGSVGYILRYDTTHKGYCVDADDENFASISRPTYEEFINEAEGGETHE